MSDRVVRACCCRSGGWLRLFSGDESLCPACGQPVEDINIDELLRENNRLRERVHEMSDDLSYLDRVNTMLRLKLHDARERYEQMRNSEEDGNA